MTVTVTESGPSEKLVSFVLTEPEIDQAKKIVARRLSREIKIKGFRPGHAPAALVENAIGTARFRTEAIEELIPDRLRAAFEENEINPAVQPELSSLDEVDGGVKVGVKVVLWPEVDAPDYQDRRVTVESPEVTEAEVEEQIDRIRDQFAEVESIARSAVVGDYVGIDVSATKDGVNVPEATAEGLLYEVGSRGFLVGLDEVLVGASSGDVVDHSAPLPSGFGDLAGQTVDFRVLVTAVNQKVLPAVTDEWVSEMTEFESVDELREDLIRRIGVVKRRILRRRFRDLAIAQLVDEVDVSIPHAVVDVEAEDVLHQFTHRLEGDGIGLDDYLQVTGIDQERLISDARDQAERSIRTRLVLEAVARAEGIEVLPEELDAFIESAAAQSDKPDQTRRLLQSRTSVLADDILRSRAMEVVISSATPVDDAGTEIDLRDEEIEDAGVPVFEAEPVEPEESQKYDSEYVDGESLPGDNLGEVSADQAGVESADEFGEASGEEE